VFFDPKVNQRVVVTTNLRDGQWFVPAGTAGTVIAVRFVPPGTRNDMWYGGNVIDVSFDNGVNWTGLVASQLDRLS
jgi:hypothetical protein